MTTLVWHVWQIVTRPTATQFVTRQAPALVILAACLALCSSLRQRSLVAWTLAWLAYLGARLTLGPVGTELPLTRQAFGQVEFAAAISLFVAGTLLYLRSRDLLRPVAAIGLVLAVTAFGQAYYLPGSPTLRFALELSYRLLTLLAAIQILRFPLLRRQAGAWLFSSALLLMDLDGWPAGFHLSAGLRPFWELLLGLGMLLLVFEQLRRETRRWGALNAVTSSLARSAEENARQRLEAFKGWAGLLGADAAWFRLRDRRRLTLFQQVGLSAEFQRERAALAEDDAVEGIARLERPTITSGAGFGNARPLFQREGLNQLVILPIPGKKAVLGCLVVAARGRRSYAPEELAFLETTAEQLGLVVENQRLVEEILRSHRQWTNTFESIQDLVLLHDSEFHILKANPALLRKISKSQAELVGQLCQAVLPNAGNQWKDCPYCRGQEEGFYEGMDPFGGFSVASTSTYFDQSTRQKATIHVVRDVTERRMAEEKYRSLFEQMHEGVFVTNSDGTLVDCNEAFVRMLGLSRREELVGHNLDREFYASREQRSRLRHEIDTHDRVRNFEVTLRRQDGSILTALETSFAVRSRGGEISGYHSFLLDITEKKQAEDEIRRRNRELNALNAMAVIATQSFDLDEILNLTLRQVISLVGAEAGSVYLAERNNHFRCRANWGRSVSDRKRFAEANFPEGLGDLVLGSRAEVLSAEYLPHLPEAVSEFVRATDSGCSLWVVLWGKDAPVGLMGISRAPGNEYSTIEENLLVAIGRQLSTTIEKVRLYEETCTAYDHLRSAQEQLLQSEKMSAIGQLIAGVAHELNNPLTAILGYAQLLETEKLEPRPLEYVEKIFKQAQRTHRVVQNLLSFARQRKPEKHAFDVIRVLEEALLLRDYDMKVSNIQLERDFPRSIPAVTGDPHQLEQVFLNIINNALDAIVERGESDGRRLTVRVMCEDNRIVIQFQDSGPGFKEPSRIFEPFYTTKGVGKGTGLGLSICYGIIQEHGGEISARNAETGGAIIELRLPAAGPVRSSAEPAPGFQRRQGVLEGTILVVDDEEAVLEFERDVLGGAGARVVTAASLDRMRTALAEESFNAVIMNGKMPGSASVADTRRWIAENWPQLATRLLFTFSNLAEPEVRSLLEQSQVPFLVKPFEIGDLIAHARKLLSKARAAGAN